MPTHNFGRFIGQTLEGIVSQADTGVEVVIVDGASTDNTRDIVLAYQDKYPFIRYVLQDKNRGVDKDLDKSVELAEGGYCWLLSSDDVPKAGAVKRLLREIEGGQDIYLFNRTDCDLKLRPVRDRLWLSPDTKDSVFSLSDQGDWLDYLSRARSIGALLSYCSSIVFRREYWNRSSYNESFTGTGYAHVHRLFSAPGGRGSLKYIREPLVLCRGDNDSFLKGGGIRRFLMDVDGYRRLAGSLLSDDPAGRTAFLGVLKHDVRLPYLIKLRSQAGGAAQWDGIEQKLVECGYGHRTLRAARLLGSLKPLVAPAVILKQSLMKSRVFLYNLKRRSS